MKYSYFLESESLHSYMVTDHDSQVNWNIQQKYLIHFMTDIYMCALQKKSFTKWYKNMGLFLHEAWETHIQNIKTKHKKQSKNIWLMFFVVCKMYVTYYPNFTYIYISRTFGIEYVL